MFVFLVQFSPCLLILTDLTNFNGAPITTANVGISSLHNGQRRLLLAEAQLITAHEIGKKIMTFRNRDDTYALHTLWVMDVRCLSVCKSI